MFVNRKLVKVLLELHRSRRSGILRAEKGPARRQLILNCGTLVFAESNLPEEHLARIMVTMALLEKTRLKEIAGMMKEGSTSEEAILSLHGLNIAGIEKSRLEQAVLITASLLGLDCNLRFYPGENLMKSRVSLGLKLPELMLLSVRHAVKTGILKVPLEFENAMFSAAMDAQSRASDFPLDSAESQALSLVNGKTGSEELLSNIPRGTLLTLYVLGLVDFEPDFERRRIGRLFSNSMRCYAVSRPHLYTRSFQFRLRRSRGKFRHPTTNARNSCTLTGFSRIDTLPNSAPRLSKSSVGSIRLT